MLLSSWIMHYEPTAGAHKDYIYERQKRINEYSTDTEFIELSYKWRQMALQRKYMNNFSWLERPLIQFPTDVLAIQELITSIKPTIVVETGIAHGGSLILSASFLKLNNIQGKVIGVDIDIRDHNYTKIRQSSLSHMIHLVEGSSVEVGVFEKVKALIEPSDRVMVFLDSDHTHNHVLKELELYSDLVSIGSYLVVFDTHIEDMPEDFVWHDRPWGKGNNPKTAVHEWLSHRKDFIIDKTLEAKLMITSAPDGFLFKSYPS